MSDTAGSAREGASAPPLILPQELRDNLYPHETIVWIQKGQGVRWPLVYTVPPVFLILMYAFFSWLIMRDLSVVPALGTIIFLGIFALFAFGMQLASVAGPIFGPASEYYVLTDERVLHHRSFPTHSTRSLAAYGAALEIDLYITHIGVWGSRARGWIMLRPDEYRALPFRFQPFPHHATSLVGVEHPLEIAALIKSTLSLGFEIEDHTR